MVREGRGRGDRECYGGEAAPALGRRRGSSGGSGGGGGNGGGEGSLGRNAPLRLRRPRLLGDACRLFRAGGAFRQSRGQGRGRPDRRGAGAGRARGFGGARKAGGGATAGRARGVGGAARQAK